MDLPKLPKLYTEAKVSPKGKVNEHDVKDWLYHALKYFSPVALMYLAQLGLALQVHQAFGLNDFVPTLMTQGAIEAWLLSQALALFSKFQNGKQ